MKHKYVWVVECCLEGEWIPIYYYETLRQAKACKGVLRRRIVKYERVGVHA